MRGYKKKKKLRGYIEDPKEEISGNKKFRAKEAPHPCYYASRDRDFPHICLFFIFWAEKSEFQVPARCSSPK